MVAISASVRYGSAVTGCRRGPRLSTGIGFPVLGSSIRTRQSLAQLLGLIDQTRQPGTFARESPVPDWLASTKPGSPGPYTITESISASLGKRAGKLRT